MTSYKVPPIRSKTLWTNLGRTDSSSLAGNWPDGKRRQAPHLKGLKVLTVTVVLLSSGEEE